MADDEVNTHIQSEEIPTEDENQSEPITHPLAVVVSQRQTPFSSVALLYLIQWVRMAFLFLNASYTVTTRVTKGILRSIQEEVYVFFEGSPHAYRYQDTVLGGPGVPSIEWYYNGSTKQFISGPLYPAPKDTVFHHLPYLSAQIKYNNLNLYDISEFIEGLRWTGEQAPTPAVLLSVWSLTTGVVLNTTGLSLGVISEQGQEQTIALGS